MMKECTAAVHHGAAENTKGNILRFLRLTRKTVRAVVLALATLLTGVQPDGAAATNRHVIVISIDALRPEFCMPGSASNACPTLAALRERGCCARRVAPVYPSLTYPGHASIVTGVTPARHGVTGNAVFDPFSGEDGRGFWYASDVKAAALWDIVHKAGCSVGAVSWPCTAGAEGITWNLPEFWGSQEGNEATMIRRYASREVLDLLERAVLPLTTETLTDAARRDEFVAACTREIIKQKQPDLMLIHLLEADHHQHKNGRSSPGLPAVMSRIDAAVGGIVAAIEKAGLSDRTTFIVTGDHGFGDVDRSLVPNVLLRRAGFIAVADGRVTAWAAMAQNLGGSAAVYINPQSSTGTLDTVQALLEKHSRNADGVRLYSIIDKESLVKIGGPACAAFCLEAETGYMFSGSWRGDSLVSRSRLKGNHGYLPTKPDMATGFIICGNGIRKGVVLEQMSLVDIAPTIAVLFGLRPGNMEGRILREVLTEAEDLR